MRTDDNKQPKPNTFTKKIGSTTYKVNVHFSKTSKENMNDKIMRLIKNDIKNNTITGGI